MACNRVWRDFLAPLFGLNLIWMESSAVSLTGESAFVARNDNENVNEDDHSSNEENKMVGDISVTEEVMKDRTENNSNCGKSDFCLFGQHPNPATKSSLIFELTASDNDELDRDNDMLCFGNQYLYIYFRLHQVLIRRLNIARSLAYSVQDDQSLITLVEMMSSSDGSDVRQKRYKAFLSLVYEFVEGGYSPSSSDIEGGKYEDRVRCLLGPQAYELETMDMLVSHILRKLEKMADDDTLKAMIDVFRRQKEQGAFKPMTFEQEAVMNSNGKNLFIFQYFKIPDSDKSIMRIWSSLLTL